VTIGAYAVIGDAATIGDRTWVDSLGAPEQTSGLH